MEKTGVLILIALTMCKLSHPSAALTWKVSMLPFVGVQPSSIPAGTLAMLEVKFNPSSKAALVGGVHLWCDIRDYD